MTHELEQLAAEYALGTLDAAQRDTAARLRATDSDFDRAVTAWERQLAPLADAIAPTAPSPGVWAAIVANLPPEASVSAAPRTDNVVSLRRAVARWRAATLGTGALAAALALFAVDRDVLRTGPAPRTGAYVAAVNRGGDMPALIVRVDLATHSVTVRPVEAETPPGKSLELWYVAAGAAPKSMGVLKSERERMPMPSDMKMTNAMFAVSVEPVGGSPTGAPTGPVVYKGMLVAE